MQLVDLGFGASFGVLEAGEDEDAGGAGVGRGRWRGGWDDGGGWRGKDLGGTVGEGEWVVWRVADKDEVVEERRW